MTLYNIIHGPEVWLAITTIAIGGVILNVGILLGMALRGLLEANGRDEEDERY